MNASRLVLVMKSYLFEAFIKMIEGLPANGILLVAELQEEMIENDLSQRRILPMEEALSILNFCRFLQAVAFGGGIFPTILPVQHLTAYRKIMNRLIEAGELPSNTNEQFDKTFLSIFPENHRLYKFGHDGVKWPIESLQRAQIAA